MLRIRPEKIDRRPEGADRRPMTGERRPAESCVSDRLKDPQPGLLIPVSLLRSLHPRPIILLFLFFVKLPIKFLLVSSRMPDPKDEN